MMGYLAALLALAARTDRWSLVRAHPKAVIDVAQSKHAGIGGFETGSFVKVDGHYHAFINELPTIQPYSSCPKLWWDAVCQLGYWTAPSPSGPWTRVSTVRQPVATLNCSGTAWDGCKIAEAPIQTWNSGGALFAPNIVNGSDPVWSLFYGNRWAVSTVPGRKGIAGPYVDLQCLDSGLQRPSFQLDNGTWRGFSMQDWPSRSALAPNCTWPCHSQRLVGATAQADGTLLGDSDWTPMPTGQLADALPFVWAENSPNVENPIVIRSTDKQRYIMVYDALSMNATCRDDPECGWVQGQCWSNKYCNEIGIAWSADGVTWVNATTLAVQTPETADAMCGLVRTPIGVVPEPETCAGCYTVMWTGWRAPTTATPGRTLHGSSAGANLHGHAWTKPDCPAGNARCQPYQGFKPVCAALIRDNEEVGRTTGVARSIIDAVR